MGLGDKGLAWRNGKEIAKIISGRQIAAPRREAFRKAFRDTFRDDPFAPAYLSPLRENPPMEPPTLQSSPPQAAECGCAQETEEQKRAHIIRIIDEFKGQQGSLIQILHLVQGVYGCLPLEIQQLVAEHLDVPLSEVYGVSTFYTYFTTRPRGEYTIRVCLGTACYVRGGAEIVKRLIQTLGVEVGETTKDRKYTLEVMRCIGACGLAPAMTINDKVYRQVNPDKLNRILASCD